MNNRRSLHLLAEAYQQVIEQIIAEIEKLPSLPSKPTTIKDKYQNVILPRVIGTTADGGRTFITYYPDEYPSQVGLPKGATVDS